MRVLRLLAWTFITAGLVIAGLAVAGYWLYRDAEGTGPLASVTTVVIPPHSGITAISTLLGEQGVVRRPLEFEAMARLSGRGGELKAGEYEFPAGASTMQALEILASGKTVKHRLTIPEGLTSADILNLVRNAPALDGDTGPTPQNGELLPETYVYSYGDTRRELIDRMRHAMTRTLAQLWAERRTDLPLTEPRDAVTLASIVEKETAREEERSHVAGVYINRLRLGMRLQADPTVLFAVSGEGSAKPDHPLTHADLAIASPYNTYVNKGLPPGPITNPSKASLRAAVHPERTDDLYFVADGGGGHIFAKTLGDQSRNIAQYRRMTAAEGDGTPIIAEPEAPPPQAASPIPAALPGPPPPPPPRPAPQQQASRIRHCRAEPGHACPH
ncbi:MAG: endolytic transglycosylase MltG [Alphaproteobacteria bacterium]|nr:endolytic transglycosylase MltG [Alphaproteobacteria bacterium]